MLGTFVHVFKNNGVLGLYSGVCVDSLNSTTRNLLSGLV